MAIDFHIFSRQTWSLTKKILLITILRHPISTAFRALILPIAFLVLLLNIKNLLEPNSRYGFGSPAPVKTLKEAIPSSQKLVFVQPPGLGQDIVTVIDTSTYFSEEFIPSLFRFASSTITFRLKENKKLGQVLKIVEPDSNRSTLLNHR
jgi:hypothetical protein